MKKSKFLKKSLAMLLALMLVVAMIPLSASAADPLPALTFISVNGVQITAEDTSFSATYPETATSVNLKATVPDGTKLYAVNKDEVHEKQVVSTDDSFSFDLFDSDPSEDVVKIVLKLKSDDPSDGREEVEYTLTLTPKANSTENGVKGIELASSAKNYGLMAVSYDDDTQVVTVTAAYGYDATNGKIEVTPVESASVNSGVKGASAEIALSAKTFNIVSEDNEATPWTIEVNEVPTLTAFSIAGKTGEFSEEKSSKVGKNDTITVTLGLDDIKNQYGEIVSGSDIWLNVGYTVYDNTKVGSSDTSSKPSMGALFNNGAALKFNFTANTNDYTCTKYIQVRTGDNSNVYEYEVKVVVPKSNDTSVLFASIGNVEATVSGNSISAVLDKTASSTQNIVLHLPKGATVTSNSMSATFNDDPGNATNPDYDKYTTASAVNLSTPQVIVVTAADGKTSKQYSVSITKSSTAGQALLTNFTLKDPAGNTYKTTVNQDTKTITSDALPYMTTNISGWTMFPVVSEGARATLGTASTPIISGQTKFSEATGLTASGWTDGDAKTVGKVTVVNQGEGGQTTVYTLEVTFQKGNTNNTLKDVTVAAMPASVTTEQALVRNLNKLNTYTGTLDTTTDPANPKIKVKTSDTHKVGGSYQLWVSQLTTNGGVAYFYDTSDNSLANIQIPDANKTTALARNLSSTTKVIVFPEAIAKKFADSVTGYSFVGDSTTNITSDDINKGTIYSFAFSNEDPSTEALLKTLKVGDTTLNVGSGAGTISGTIPYSMTVDASVLDSAVSQNLGYFLNFTLSDYATLGSTYESSGAQDVDFVLNGDANFNGQPDDDADDANAKLLFVRDDDNKVKVYVLNGTTTTMSDPADYIIDENNPLVVTSEAGSPDTNDYIFNLTYANAQTEAKVTSFKLGNTSGTISGQTITVAMPFGSEVDALVPTFALSTGATAYVNGVKLVSGETVLDCTNDVKIKVLSEDGKTSNIYTLKVTVSAQFSDIKESDWYYDNVMRAVELGILSGYTDGTFRPMNNITRRDFAIMLAQALGNSNDNDGTAVSRFPDVADDDYGVVSINYLYDNEITVGDEKGNFNPDANITRQEAAIFLAKAFEATGTTSETFTDDAKIASWAKSFVYAAKAAGLMNGDVNGAFRPTDKLTRAEAASVMVNAVDK